MKIYLLLMLSLLMCAGCNTSNKPHIEKAEPLPKDLNESLSYLQNNFKSQDLAQFKNQNENDAFSALHFSTGLLMRNNWIRGSRDTALLEYFHKLGVYNPDDISSIIITSFHRKLNNKAIDLKGQVEVYKKYWGKINDCDKESSRAALNEYKKYGLHSSITILMEVDTSQNKRNAVSRVCPQINWKFDSKKDLKIKGTIIEKYFINDTSNVFFKVKIGAMNYTNTTILMNKVKVGDIVDLAVENLTISNK